MEYLKAKEVESHSQLPQPEEPRRGTTFLKTCFNGLNALSGVGILSIPYALSQGGWLSLILLFLVAVLCWYTGLLLKRCMDSDPLIRSYPDIGEKAFGYKGRVVVSIFMYLELYLVAVEFLILEGDNLYKLFPNAGFKLAGLYIGGKTAFVLLTALVILPTTWLKSLGMLAYVSAGGVSASIILVGCVLWVGAVDGVGFHEDGVLLNWGGLPTTLSLFTFCYCGHAVFPTLCNSMKDRSQFSKVLLVSFVTSTVTYGSMAVLGLPHVWRIFEVSGDLKPANPKNWFAISNIHHSSQSPDEICGHHCSNRYCYRGDFCFPRQQISQHPRQDSAFFSVTVSMLLPCLCYLRIDKSARSFGLELVFIVGILMIGSFVGIIGTIIFLSSRYTSDSYETAFSIQFSGASTKRRRRRNLIPAGIMKPLVSKPNSTLNYARQMFETISQPEIALFNSYVWRHSRSTAPLKAISLFIGALNHNLFPGYYSFPSLLETCAVAKALRQGKQFAIKPGLNENTYAFRTLINMHTGCNDVDGAQRVFGKILEPCVVMSGYVRSSRPNEALSLFRQLQARGT
ncbi:hypothetical protein OIU77_012312 [Salix suchowensis]|uniref:Amino acid transporter transmembrane domain-containing protein n=1 Tax=Salix suchowensis TaxID=1278906 RepID=A0ABQ9A391_9ROSI|nr:hypothetical protein OIU77_012312 [Salix suchowensis]